MPEKTVQEEIVRIYDRDENGNVVKNQLDWHNQVADATIEFYVVHLQVTHRTWRALRCFFPVSCVGSFFFLFIWHLKNSHGTLVTLQSV